jgi:hypothetical protein
MPSAGATADANAYRKVGAAYLEIATLTATDRPANLKAAISHLEKSAALLHDFKAPAEVEPRRQKELKEIEAELTRSQRLRQ